MSKHIIEFLNGKGIFFAEELVSIDKKRLSAFTGLNKLELAEISNFIKEFKSSDIITLVKFKRHSINELGLPHTVKIKLYSENYRFIEDMLSMQSQNLRRISGISKSVAIKIVESIKVAVKADKF